ncbi:type IV pilus twitching motility protein PilT [Candidatus Falkowbacteria bacterium]|jgi:twitching motility protein PilT|nr:type IV pilus twitching motility protein PilT [Candidatus Falkowbacteria bacterium]MBT7007519.1 type IV pilus twitching motility protein PilT [Candidatus Falkowbacteria bacterium]
MPINEIFTLAIKKGASDIHLVSGKLPIFRIDGQLVQIKQGTQAVTDNVIFGLLNEKQKEIIQEMKELDASYQLKDGARLRINLYYEKNKLCLAARIIAKQIPTLEDIGAPESFKDLLNYQEGLILVTGPTGCGKSTTLAAMINYLNQNYSYHISTIEDPIEYLFENNKSFFTQRQVGRDTNSFNSALKHVFRQDPDVIMVGEMRDLETIATAITLAETGHLVLSTLHTHTAGQTIDRIIDVFPPYQQEQVKIQTSITLRGIISQRLLPKIGGGRLANWEVLLNNPAIANSIREGKIPQIQNVVQTSSAEGMISAKRHLDQLKKQELIDEDVYNRTKAQYS